MHVERSVLVREIDAQLRVRGRDVINRILERMKLTLQQLEAHRWGAANILCGKTAGQVSNGQRVAVLALGEHEVAFVAE